MIKINLIAQKRTRKRDKGEETVTLGLLIVLLAGGLVYFLVHRPLASDVEGLQRVTSTLARENREKEAKLKGYTELKEAVKAAEERTKVIMRLDQARATPAHLLHELSTILTPKRTPTMTTAMIKELEKNPNRELSLEWDSKHVWITRFAEEDGEFTLEGGAQSDGDMTQLALRLQASVFFHDVIPQGGQEAVDKESGINYYRFTIVGKVAY